jgi:hypothetical protein
MAPSKAPNKNSEAWKLTEWVARFCSAVFNRRLGPSRAVYEQIDSALNVYGYTPESIKLAYWGAKCIPDQWLGNRIEARDVGPELVVRHKGGQNKETGKPAVQWLDDLSSRSGEMNRIVVGYVLKHLVPEDMKAGEKALLESEGIEYECLT